MTHVIFDHLFKSFHAAPSPVLNDFSLEVKSGELVALLGPSGIGKSTLLKLVAGIERPDAGDICFNGSSILSIAPNQREAVLMFQKAYLFPFLTVGENIAFGLKVKGVSKRDQRTRVTEMLELIGLPDMKNRRPDQLSGGEQQRVALARALIIRPKVLLLDEPFNSLDTQVRLSLQEAVRGIQRELGITTIMVTHDLNEAMAMSDRMALLLGGKVMAFSTPNELFQRPPCVSSAKFVGITTFMKGETNNGWLYSAMGKLKISNEQKTESSIYAIRPEHIRIQPKNGEDGLLGTVLTSLYRGEYMEYQIALGENRIRAHVPATETPLPNNTQVQVLMPAEHLFEVRG